MNNRLQNILETVNQLLESRKKIERRLAGLISGPTTPSTRLPSELEQKRIESIPGRETILSPVRGSGEAKAYLTQLLATRDKRGRKGFVKKQIPAILGGTKPAGVEAEPVPAHATHITRDTSNPSTYGGSGIVSMKLRDAIDRATRAGRIKN